MIKKLSKQNLLKPNSLSSEWELVKLHEMYLFFAIIPPYVYCKKPNLNDYRSTTGIPFTSFASR